MVDIFLLEISKLEKASTYIPISPLPLTLVALVLVGRKDLSPSFFDDLKRSVKSRCVVQELSEEGLFILFAFI